MKKSTKIISATVLTLGVVGGGDIPEGVDKALDLACAADFGWRKRSAKAVVVIGDAPPHPPDVAGLLERMTAVHERDGIVIHPTAEAWKEAPEIEEGATVHKNQVLLLMPDMSQMQVKIGIHESLVDRVDEGKTARVKLRDEVIDATVSSVSLAARPAGWWSGSVVKYDTIIRLPTMVGLKPGMIRISAGFRPAFAPRSLTSWANAMQCSSDDCGVNTASATLAANDLPASEAPA